MHHLSFLFGSNLIPERGIKYKGDMNPEYSKKEMDRMIYQHLELLENKKVNKLLEIPKIDGVTDVKAKKRIVNFTAARRGFGNTKAFNAIKMVNNRRSSKFTRTKNQSISSSSSSDPSLPRNSKKEKYEEISVPRNETSIGM